jgi:hypothetical protein
MPELDQLGTTSDGLWGSVGLDQPLELIKDLWSQLKSTLRVHGGPHLSGDYRYFYKLFSF